MLRKFAFAAAGIGIFICGGILGPQIWNFIVPAETAVVESDKKATATATQETATKTVSELESQKTSPPAEEKTTPTEKLTEPQTAEGTVASDKEPAQPVDGMQAEVSPSEAESLAPTPSPLEGTEEEEHTLSLEEEEDLPAVKEQIIIAKMEAGDSLSVIFEDYTDAQSAFVLAKAIDKEFSVKSFRVGQPYLIENDAELDKILRFEYEINSREKLIVVADGDKYKVTIEKIHYDRKLAYLEGIIDGSLFLTVEKLNESPQLALQVANMFQWDINFIRDVQAGDSFSILVEKLYRDGEFKGYGKAIGATFTNNGKKYESFLYYDSNKKEMHYNAKGENKRKVLLQSPLSFTRVTSGYTHSRKHPVYGTYRPHLGIDYGAPTGTPIMAVGDGTISYFGWRGGYGKHITVRHASGLESMYSHMSRYGRGLKKGSKVRQGQVIGYVGSTGVSTGPHLDFRLKQNGKFINPGKAINPRAAAVSKVHKDGYEARKKMVREFMDGTRSLESYDPKSIELSQK